MTTENQKSGNAEGSLNRLVRVRAEWRDAQTGVVYLLQKYFEPPKILKIIPWVRPGTWETVTMFTEDLRKAQKWAEHYGIEIEYETGLKQPNGLN